jgi:putative transposase
VTDKLASHFVWCPTYRKKILGGKLALFVEQAIRQICEARQWAIGALNIQPDHVHLFLSAPPSVAPSEMARQVKGATAGRVFQRFPEVKKQLWGGAFWSGSSYVGSVGDMSGDTVLKSIEVGQD